MMVYRKATLTWWVQGCERGARPPRSRGTNLCREIRGHKLGSQGVGGRQPEHPGKEQKHVRRLRDFSHATFPEVPPYVTRVKFRQGLSVSLMDEVERAPFGVDIGIFGNGIVCSPTSCEMRDFKFSSQDLEFQDVLLFLFLTLAFRGPLIRYPRPTSGPRPIGWETLL
ncbi:hypothetical protein AVEN_73288-1 [Araneus ventricosus]|uniref:Uncharacterized protein n=1 Tax=Araneus ventricosus TaxID=182803 RepID=A0A4Y2KK09_ARAVE|nr:hypothetical protein AVEN_73288-1 [Araneus ventricosus]